MTKKITMKARRGGKTLENAYLLIASARAALINGVKHYDKNGKFLETEKEILETLFKDHAIQFDTNERIQRTTDEEQLEIVMKEFSNV